MNCFAFARQLSGPVRSVVTRYRSIAVSGRARPLISAQFDRRDEETLFEDGGRQVAARGGGGDQDTVAADSAGGSCAVRSDCCDS